MIWQSLVTVVGAKTVVRVMQLLGCRRQQLWSGGSKPTRTAGQRRQQAQLLSSSWHFMTQSSERTLIQPWPLLKTPGDVSALVWTTVWPRCDCMSAVGPVLPLSEQRSGYWQLPIRQQQLTIVSPGLSGSCRSGSLTGSRMILTPHRRVVVAPINSTMKISTPYLQAGTGQVRSRHAP